MIFILAATVGGSVMATALAWTQGASLLSMMLIYVAGGWAGLLAAAAFLLLRRDRDGEDPARARPARAPGQASPLAGPLAVLRGQAR